MLFSNRKLDAEQLRNDLDNPSRGLTWQRNNDAIARKRANLKHRWQILGIALATALGVIALLL